MENVLPFVVRITVAPRWAGFLFFVSLQVNYLTEKLLFSREFFLLTFTGESEYEDDGLVDLNCDDDDDVTASNSGFRRRDLRNTDGKKISLL